YRAFERTLVGSVDPRSVIELALGYRLANLLWRLRRASAIETGLFEIQGEFLLAQRQSSAREQPGAVQTARVNGHGKMLGSNGPHEPPAGDRESLSTSMHSTARTRLEVPSHRPTILAPFQSSPDLA